MSVPAAETVTAPCPRCGEPIAHGDLFCEACGQQLSVDEASPDPASERGDADRADPACVFCGAEGPVIDDGYCGMCGMKQPAAHDHEEHVVPGAAAVTDRGRHHVRNEDAVALARRGDGRLVAVVCDGVSTTVDPDEASALAATAALGILVAADLDTGGDPIAAGLVDAYLAAREAVRGMTFRPDAELGTPSCTFLAAVVTPPDVVDVAGLGDCRAYLVDARAATEAVLTSDDSWAAEQVAAGTMSAEDAYRDPLAHTLTRWIGLDADPEWRPTLTHAAGTGRLVLCSDGLWNYTIEPGRLTAVSRGGDRDGPSPLAVARRLVAFANDQGGHDNVTVVAVDLPLPATET